MEADSFNDINEKDFVSIDEEKQDKFDDLHLYPTITYDYNELITEADHYAHTCAILSTTTGCEKRREKFCDPLNFKTFYTTNWRRILSDPMVNVFPKHQQYKQLSAYTLRGTNMKNVLEKKHKEDAWQSLVLLKTGQEKIEQTSTMARGNKLEPVATAMISSDYDDALVAEIGNVWSPDPRFKSVLASSPDIVFPELELSVEVKSPEHRDVFKHMPQDHLSQLKVMKSELLNCNWDPMKYWRITHFPIEYTGLLDEMSGYWHQMQLQMHCLDLKLPYCIFQQYSTTPNYLLTLSSDNVVQKTIKLDDPKARPFYTETVVQKDQNWLENNAPTFIEAAEYIFTRVQIYFSSIKE